jgi:membrane associated rhomboid family serine protease
MPNQQQSKIDIAAWVAIALGLVLGFLLKRVKFGFIFGLILGVVIVFLWSRKRRKQ